MCYCVSIKAMDAVRQMAVGETMLGTELVVAIPDGEDGVTYFPDAEAGAVEQFQEAAFGLLTKIGITKMFHVCETDFNEHGLPATLILSIQDGRKYSETTLTYVRGRDGRIIDLQGLAICPLRDKVGMTPYQSLLAADTSSLAH